MPRSPLVTSAVRDLAKYFNATTDAAFIDRTWKINSVAASEESRKDTTAPDAGSRLGAYGEIYKSSEEYTVGTPIADNIANLIHGAVCVGSFQGLSGVWPLPKEPNDYSQQLRLYEFKKGITSDEDEVVRKNKPILLGPDNRLSDKPKADAPNIYAAEIFNPYISPAVKDTGAVEIFMNAIPTLEFSKCVPYVNVEVVSLLRTAGTVAPPLTLVGFLNPSSLGSADAAMINAQGTTVRSEASTLGSGLRSGMELFTAPQTLTNLGAGGKEFVPVIDRMRPLASLGNLSLSTKIQGGTMSFTTGRLELVVHDRSRLREAAVFVRPDLYGTTFLDITYGWSHPEGGISSSNVYGRFLDALKTTTRFRIAGSTYAFEEGGQMKITLNIQTVGSTDLLYLGPAQQTNAMKKMQGLIRELNSLLVERRSRSTTPSMAEYDFLSSLLDPSSALAAAADKDVIRKVVNLVRKLPSGDAIRSVLEQLVGKDLTKNDVKVKDEASAIDEAQDSTVEVYTDIIKKIPTFSEDDFGTIFRDDQKRFGSLNDNTFYASVEGKSVGLTKIVNDAPGSNRKAEKNLSVDPLGSENFISYGSAFMNLVAQPIADSGQYDEVQVVFYPFNKYAGAVHGLPISCFPMETTRFEKCMDELARRSPSVSCRQIIGMMYDRFTHFQPSRAYLMAGFYDQTKVDEGAAELRDPKAKYIVDGKEYTASVQLTHEQRLQAVGIPEARFTLPVVQVAVEGAPLTDASGEIIKDDNGNPKSLIKIHVYDSAMDPYSTITDIIRSAKDNELGIITIPVAKLNSTIRANAGDPGGASDREVLAALEVIKAGKEAGILEAVNIDNMQPADRQDIGPLDAMRNNSTFYRVAGDYDSIKSLVTSAVPKIVYGTSTSAMINASLSSNTSAGLGNVQLLRAFTEPGEVRAESLNTGVPMLVVPSQLSISTIGCPLFSPMQRLFMDFGTGTSIDNLYHVISFDSTIGKDGFKTDVKLGFADGFAAYRSLNQNLALLAASLESGTSGQDSQDPAAENPSVDFDSIVKSPEGAIESSRKRVRQSLVAVVTPLAQLEATSKARIEKELQAAKAKISAKGEAEKDKIQAEIESIVPEEVKIKIAEGQRKVTEAAAKVKSEADPVIRAKKLADQYTQIIALAETLPGDSGLLLLQEAADALQDARDQASEKS